MEKSKTERMTERMLDVRRYVEGGRVWRLLRLNPLKRMQMGGSVDRGSLLREEVGILKARRVLILIALWRSTS